MRGTELIGLALKNIAANKMRTLLTMLGIIIGVGAVIVIVGLGKGMENYMKSSFQDMGANHLTVNLKGRGNSSRSISEDDFYAFVAENPQDFAQISPTVSVSDAVKVGSKTAEYTSVTGVSEDYLGMKSQTITQGRGLTYLDGENREQVCVVGSYFAQRYLPAQPIGANIRIQGKAFTVVGVLKAKDTVQELGNADDAVYLPASTAARLSGQGSYNAYTLAVRDEGKMTEAKQTLENFLNMTLIDKKAYSVMSMGAILAEMNKMVAVVVGVLTTIAGISLLVGGIGIMNIMLVSVAERTREIGIRKSLGAKEQYILGQFITEATVTSALGGTLGIVLGLGLSLVATSLAKTLLGHPISVMADWNSILIAFGISAGIGILFGYLPAKKAAALNPIDALRL